MDPAAVLPHQTISQAIYLRWATRSDIPAITKIFHAFLSVFEAQDHVTPRRNEKPEEFYLLCLKRMRVFFSKPGMRIMVAERLAVKVASEEREVIGFSAWDAQGENNPVRQEWIRQDETWARALERQLAHVEVLHHRYLRNTVFDYEAFAELWRRLEAASGHEESLKNNLHLQLLAVSPEWQKGYGVGRRLLQWGIDVSDQTGLPIVIESSLTGYPFYMRMGCRLLTHVRIDMLPEKAFDMPIVVYEPKTKDREDVTA